MKASPDVNTAVEQASQMAFESKHKYVTTEHILLALLSNNQLIKILEHYGIVLPPLRKDIASYIENLPVYTGPDDRYSLQKTIALDRVINRAYTTALFSHRNYLAVTDVFISILSESETHSSYFLKKHGIIKEDFVNYLADLLQQANSSSGSARKAGVKMGNSESKSALDEYCTNLSALAKSGKIESVIGRDSEIADICQVFARKNKSNILLVGDPGVGKTAAVEGFAKKINEGAVPNYLKNHTVYSLEVGKLLAGTQFRGQFEGRVQNILEELVEKKKSILFIDEAHTVQGAGNSGHGGTDFANMIKPYLSKGDLKVIASTTWEEYSKSFEKDRALMRRFYKIALNEPTPELAKEILMASKSSYEKFHKAKISAETVDTAVDYSVRYMADKKLPDKAFDLIDSACARQRQKNKKKISITKGNILFEVSKLTGISIENLDMKQSAFNIESIENKIKSRLFGQDTAVNTVLEYVYVAKAGLNKPNKPIGTFIFTGQTGTGKTEFAKTLAECLNMKLNRYDMSEYQERHAVSRLIGAPPGYVGYDDGNLAGGLLIKDIKQNANSILLFDEIEKAHPDISNLFLQLMDEGTITSSSGDKVNAKNCIIIMTTNLGASDNEKNTIGFNTPLERTGAEDTAYAEFFKPEFRNRIDAVCKFNALSESTKRKIVVKFIDELDQQLKLQNVSLLLDEEAIDFLLEKGFTTKNGARPLARTIDREIRVPVSKMLLFNKPDPGSIAKVFVNNGSITITMIPPKQPARVTATEDLSVPV